MLTHGITRKPGRNFADGQTTADLGSPSYDQLMRQYNAYVETLRTCGLEIIELEALENHPDGYFVEDTAVVAPEFAIVTRPGARSRRGEEQTIEKTLRTHRQTIVIEAPGTVDGGDILMVDSHFYIGVSQRTNAEGASQLGRIVEEYGYTQTIIPVSSGLHLKSSVSYIGNNVLLITEDLAQMMPFRKYEQIVLNPDEAYAANALFINEHVIIPDGFSTVLDKLDGHNCMILQLDMSEARKMDGGLTCMSLRF